MYGAIVVREAYAKTIIIAVMGVYEFNIALGDAIGSSPRSFNVHRISHSDGKP